MQRLFEFDEHIGDWRVLVQTRDIQNGAIQSRHIVENAVTGDKIATRTIEGRNIADDAVTGDKIAANTVTGRNIGKRAISSSHIKENSITGDEFCEDSINKGKLANDAVQTRNIKDRNITSEKIKKGAVLPEHFTRQTLIELHKDLQNQIDSFNKHGVSVSNEFGSDPHIGISQKTLTDAFNKVWQKIEEITGEVLQGFSMVVTPEYFVSEDGCNIHISVNTAETNGVFEKLSFYINGTLVTEAENVDFFEYDTEITETSVVKCVAKIMGVEYPRQQIITHYNSFWLGAGTSYTDVMQVTNIIPITNGMRGAYNVEVKEGQSIIIVVGDSLRARFIRADLNGVEIQFTETSVTVGDKQYIVLKSEPWNAGTYNIDING